MQMYLKAFDVAVLSGLHNGMTSTSLAPNEYLIIVTRLSNQDTKLDWMNGKKDRTVMLKSIERVGM